MLAKINNFKIRYGFVNQILQICKANIVVALKKRIIPRSQQYMLEKYCQLLMIR